MLPSASVADNDLIETTPTVSITGSAFTFFAWGIAFIMGMLNIPRVELQYPSSSLTINLNVSVPV